MGKIGKTFALILTIIIAMSCVTLLTAKPVNAQTVAIPTFTISTFTGSYVTPTTYSTNPYTGAEVTHQGSTVTYFNITFTIQNPPFFTVQNPPITSSYFSYFYILQYKGHYTSQWTPLVEIGSDITIPASSGSQTVIILSGSPISNPITLSYVNAPFINADSGEIIVPFGGKVDFRLQAISSNGAFIPKYSYPVQGNISAFSAVQTVTIPSNFTSISTSSPTSTSTPAIPEFPSLLIIVPLVLSVFSVAVILRHRRTAKLKH
jgi:hypothetical protein